MKRILPFAVATALLMTLAAPATAATMQKPEKNHTFSVIGDLELNPDGTVTISSLKSLGVNGATANPTSRSSALEAMSTRSPYEITASWNDNKNMKILMRYGTSAGFGYRKITDKHNLNTPAVRTSTQHPYSRVVESATATVYKTRVYELQCNALGICKIKNQVILRTLVNPKPMTTGDRKMKGIITSYCTDKNGGNLPPKCPTWVKNAANAGS